MLSKVIQEVENNFKLHIPDFFNKKYLILFSGGMDSVLLTELMTAFIPVNHIFLLYCHYHLREKENILELNLLKKIANTKKVQYFIHEESLQQYSKNLQAQARKIRLTAAQKIQKEYAINFLITAHHADDFLETFFLKILAGKSPQNLVERLAFKKKNILHPLFHLTKKTIACFVEKNNFSYVEDSSNKKNIYQRNYLRNKIFPLLDERFPHWKNNIFLGSKYLQEYNQLAKKKIEDYGEIKKKTIFLKFFFHLSASARITTLHYFFTLMYPAKRFSQNFFKAINKKIADGKNSKTLAVIYNRKVIYSYGWIGEEILFHSQVLQNRHFFILDNVVISFNYSKVPLEKSQKSMDKIVISIPRVKQVTITHLSLSIRVMNRQKKMTLKKLLSDNKIPQMMRNGLLGVFEKEKLMAIITPYYFLRFEKLNLLLKNVNHNIDKQEREIIVTYVN